MIGSRRVFAFAALALAAGSFALYFASALRLEQNGATLNFGADSWYYTKLAEGRLLEQLAEGREVTRTARFHPVTVVLVTAWMNAFAFLTTWVDPENLLKAFFAATGAAGVFASVWAMAAVLPRYHALLGAAIYAVSASVWYFSSIEESKIVSATLVAIYIALYMRLRERCSVRGVWLLTLALLIACLNEIVSVFLLAIPFMEVFAKSRFNWRGYRWLFLHALAGPLAILLMEIGGGLLLGPEPGRQWQSHFRLFLHFIHPANYGLENLYQFFLNWFFFSIAAPGVETQYRQIAPYGGYFDPSFMNYFTAPWSAGIVVIAAWMIVANLLTKFQGSVTGERYLLLGMAGYSLVRAAFFFIFAAQEPFLFSSSIVLPHIMMVLIPFMASSAPARGWTLGAFAALLFVTNALFIMYT